MTTGTFPTPAVRVTATVSAEMRKARSFPAITRTLLYGAVVVLIAGVFGVVQMSQFAAQGRSDALGGLSIADWPLMLLHYGQVVPILLGAWVIGQDLPLGARHTAFLATARRGTLITVNLLVAALAGLLAGLVCIAAALVPLLASGGAGSEATVSLAPYGWLIGYWVLIAVVSAALVAATRSITVTVVPILIWTIGLSDLLAARIPALAGTLDQTFKYAYLQHGALPGASALIASGAQVAVAISIGVTAYLRRDAQ